MTRRRPASGMVLSGLVVLITLTPDLAAGQEPITLTAAVQTALAHNASIRAIRAGADAAASQVTESRSGFYPRISVAESWQRGDQPVFVFSSRLSARQFTAADFALDALNHPDPVGFFRTSIGVEQLLFSGGRQQATADAAARQLDIARAATDEASAGIAVATVQTFGRVVTAEAAHRAAESALEAAREDLARTERRRDAGMATDADVLALVVHVADLRQRGLQADGDAAVAHAELNRLMGNPIDAEFRVVVPTASDIDLVTDHPDLKVLLAEAVAARPEIRRADAAEALADAGRRESRAALIPQVAAQAAVDVSGTRFNDRASSWIVGGELRWTFATGGADVARVNAATASLVRARAEAEEARAAVHVDVVSAVRRLESARAREEAGRAAADEARESQRIIRDRFEAGIASVTDVLRAASAVLNADANRTAALVDAMLASAMLRRSLGRTP